ncbi:MAG TPA: glycosyltransferase family 10 [Rhabdochlamydiaceae bacterium]|nr:glycosyltransferase family 10 [Rhabdochlamydiaceae bacterium]
MKYLLALIAISSAIFAAPQKKVELVVNFPVNAEALNQVLEKENFHIEISDLKKYMHAWKKSKESALFRLFKTPIYQEAPVSKILFWNINRPYRKHFDFSEFSENTFVLFLWEPPTQMANMYLSKNLNCFSKIYTWDDSLVDGRKFFKFYYPVLQSQMETFPSFAEKKLCTLIASNKKSHHPKELYSERRKVIDFFEQKEGDDFTFYGNFWKPEEFKHCGGKIKDKLEVLKNYRFCICYENMRDVQGYVTEKIFDCFAAGVVPVYWGATNISQFVPTHCFIDKTKFSSLEELYHFLKNMKEEEYENYLRHIKEYLKSDQAQLFSTENFHKILIHSLK